MFNHSSLFKTKKDNRGSELFSPRILMIGNYLNSPRHNRNVWQALAEHLSMRGWKVLTVSSRESQIARLLDMLLTIIFQRKNYDLAQIDVFSGRAFLFANCCSWLISKFNIPLVLTLHGGGLAEFSSSNSHLIDRVFSRASMIVTPSPFLQQSLKSYRDDIMLIPNPIEMTTAIFRSRKNPKPNLIWVRAFHQIYNPLLAIRVIALLYPEFPCLRLLMIGPDKSDGSLDLVRAEACKLGVDHIVEFVGGVKHDEIPDWLNKADIFINTTNYDAAPRSVLEAMANGLCVVSTNVGGVPYIIQNGKDGLLVPPDDPEAMANIIKQILSDPKLSEYLSENAHEKATTYDWGKILPEWEKLFLILLDNNKIVKD